MLSVVQLVDMKLKLNLHSSKPEGLNANITLPSGNNSPIPDWELTLKLPAENSVLVAGEIPVFDMLNRSMFTTELSVCTRNEPYAMHKCPILTIYILAFLTSSLGQISLE